MRKKRNGVSSVKSSLHKPEKSQIEELGKILWATERKRKLLE